LQHVHLDSGLIVCRSTEHLRLTRGNRRVAIDEFGGHATQSLDTEREWGDIEQYHVSHLTFEHAGLDCCAHRDNFVGIHALVWLLFNDGACLFHNPRHAGHAADHHEFVDVIGCHAGILQAGLHRRNEPLEQVVTKLLHLGARKLQLYVLGPARVRRNKGEVDLVFCSIGKRDFRFPPLPL